MLPGLYIHIPFCLRKCAYCDFYSITDCSLIRAFRSALRLEMRLYRGWANPFDTIYLGGGTPTLLPDEDIAGIIADLRNTFALTADAEITVEANPGDVNQGLLRSLRRAGVNRLNIGVQSFDDDSLALLGRHHTVQDSESAIHLAREAGFDNVGIDLIYGLPSQPADHSNSAKQVENEAAQTSDRSYQQGLTAENNFLAWIGTLKRAVSLNPDHISCYQLTLSEKTSLAGRCARGELILPDDALQADYFLRTSQLLDESGYLHYEVSNFARRGCESRHNRKYWDHTPYLGLGPAAHSFNGRERRWNVSSVHKYIEYLESGRAPVEAKETLSCEELRTEALFLGFRTSGGIFLESFKEQYGMDLLSEKRETVERLLSEGLVEIAAGFLRPTRAGMAVADSLALI